MIVIPSNLKIKAREYKLIKVYEKNRYALYEDTKTKAKISFTFYDLGLIKENKEIMRGFKRNPDRVKI